MLKASLFNFLLVCQLKRCAAWLEVQLVDNRVLHTHATAHAAHAAHTAHTAAHTAAHSTHDYSPLLLKLKIKS